MPRTASSLLPLSAAMALGWAAPAAAGDIVLTAADQTKLHAVAKGEGTKGAVLVHMLGRSSDDWSFFADRLSKSQVRTVAVDLRGHGKSDRADLRIVLDLPEGEGSDWSDALRHRAELAQTPAPPDSAPRNQV